jgi:membrane protein
MGPARPAPRALVVGLLASWKRHGIQDIAASITFWSILSIAPAALAMTALLGWMELFIGEEAAADVRREIIDFVESTLGTSGGEITTTLVDILSTPSGGVALVGFVIAVWSMSKGFAGLFRGLARIHGVPEARNNLRGRLLGLAFGLATVLLIIVLLLSVVVGPLLGFEKLLPNEGGVLVDIWSVVRWPVLAAAAVAWVALMLCRGSGADVPWRQALPGAALATAGWWLVTSGVELYVQLSSGANPLLRSLGTLLVSLYWLYLLVVALLLGGALNALLNDGEEPLAARAG